MEKKGRKGPLELLRNSGWGTDQEIGGFGKEPGIKPQLMSLI